MKLSKRSGLSSGLGVRLPQTALTPPMMQALSSGFVSRAITRKRIRGSSSSRRYFFIAADNYSANESTERAATYKAAMFDDACHWAAMQKHAR
jgi:hypothetical protein